ncbi:MAG: methylmalonyl-CoA mutase family protein [Verrucomicrobia bacterium]|nr:methylmalonyl-CoA mutase family protein [Verrucomicrobiota bacterium]
MDPESVHKGQKQWEKDTLRKALKQMPELREQFETLSGIPVERLYLPEGDESVTFPGEYPFTRGVHPTMYRSRLWTMRQYAGFATAEMSNERYKYLLEQGQTGLSVAFDLPTQIGYDSDDRMAAGEVGRVGVAIDTLEDMRKLFDGIPLDSVSTSMTINATAPVLLALYIETARAQGATPDKLRGTLQNDILKEYVARGTYIFPPAPSLRLVTDVVAYCVKNVPQWNPISISGYHMREAGATAVQEVAFTLANAIAYVESAIAAGLNVDDFAPRFSFFFAVHTDVFEEAAKFRAARRLFARIMKERFKAKDPRSQMLRVHAQTGGVTLTAQQPDNNVVRVTLQSLAAVLGGTQSLHANARDEALCLPTEGAAKLALRTQQVIAHESGVTNTVDPLGGSYYVEQLTDQIEGEAEELIQKIDDMGGVVTAIERRFVQSKIEESAYRYGQSVESGDRAIVGVNKFAEEEELKIELFKMSEEVAARQCEALAAVRVRRDNGQVGKALDAIAAAASGTDNVMPHLLDAVRADASVGEICQRLREVWGEYQHSSY